MPKQPSFESHSTRHNLIHMSSQSSERDGETASIPDDEDHSSHL